MTDCFHEPTAADLPRMPGLLGEQVGQVRSAPGQLLALRHATARRVLDDMKRGAIRERILASVRWSASAGLGCEFLCTALERTVPGGRAPRFRRISRPVVFACPARGMLPNSSGSMVDVLSRALRLPYGLPQSSSTISSCQVGPAECLLQCPRLCQRQPLHNERIGVCHVPRPKYFSEQACTAPRSFHRTSSDGGGAGTESRLWLRNRRGNNGWQRAGGAFRGGADSYFDTLDGATATAVQRAASSLESPGGSSDQSHMSPMAETSCEIKRSNQHERLIGEMFD